jgi:hypothetical protein
MYTSKKRLNLFSSSSRFGLLANELVHSAEKYIYLCTFIVNRFQDNCMFEELSAIAEGN